MLKIQVGINFLLIKKQGWLIQLCVLDLDEETKSIKAEREKVKGNEAFGSGNYDEALIYYTRSIQLIPNAAAYNNRALTCEQKYKH